MAGIFGSGAELAIRSVLMRMGSGEETVGLYAASFTLTVSYARLIFMAMDADYFPRLSVAVARREEMNLCINRQTDILTVLIVPFLIVFALALPLVVRILYTEEFLPIVPMTICALAYMFFKAVFLPAAYLPLAAGHSRTFMLMELAYSIPFVGLVAGGYALGGLVGASIGLSASNAYNLVLVTVVYRRRYGFRFATATARRCLYQGLCLGGGLAAASLTDPLMKYGFGAAALTLSVALSWHMLGRETDLFQRFFRKKDR